MRRLFIGLAIALSGCTFAYGADLEPGCTIDNEDADGDGQISEICGGRDCDDSNATTYWGAPELCNEVDDDCDNSVDEGLAAEQELYYQDCDGDGYGDDSVEVETSCERPTDGAVCAVASDSAGWVTPTDADFGFDCDDSNADRHEHCGACAQVDFLIVMDSTASMTGEQRTLAGQLPALVHLLKNADINGDDIPDGEPIQDIQVAVVTADLGAGGYPSATCDAGSGADGLLRETGACGAEEGEHFLTFRPEDSDSVVAQFGEQWSCLISAGTDGCEFEQPLEAVLKALTPASSTLRFSGDTLGHGDGLNAGFLREDSLLVVMVVTDEDDCSVADPDLYNPASTTYSGNTELRCSQYEDEALHPISRFVGGLLALRDADDLIFGVVGGVPQALVPGPPAIPENPETPVEDTLTADTYAEILADPAMQQTAAGGDLLPSCTTPWSESAEPPRRLLSVSQELEVRGVNTVLASICDPMSYVDVVRGLLIAAAEGGKDRCGSSAP